MRYYKYSLWEGINSGSIEIQNMSEKEWDKNSLEYLNIYNQIRDKLSIDFVKQFEKYSGFHDWHLYSLELNYAKNKVEICIEQGGVNKKIIYNNVKKCLCNLDVNTDNTWGYCELLPIKKSLYSHEILLTSGETIYIEFKIISISEW